MEKIDWMLGMTENMMNNAEKRPEMKGMYMLSSSMMGNLNFMKMHMEMLDPAAVGMMESMMRSMESVMMAGNMESEMHRSMMENMMRYMTMMQMDMIMSMQQ